ncbi:MAG: hypothetical protein PHF29_04595 [Candidatus Riflebacteria bacterium]|nr:hypothetical protein [Candidatus Riflebacteria bacterium]
MNRKIIAVFLLLLLITGDALFAKEGDKNVITEEISVSRLGHVYIERTKIEGMMASFDKIVRTRGGKDLVLFDSEGRYIEKVYEQDLDGDGMPEFLVQMALGGSGDYKEFALLRHNDGVYEQIWEASGFSGGRAVLKKYLNKTRIFIRYNSEEGELTKPKIDAFELDEGKIIKVSGGKAG